MRNLDNFDSQNKKRAKKIAANDYKILPRRKKRCGENEVEKLIGEFAIRWEFETVADGCFGDGKR